MQKTLDQKLAAIHADPSGCKDFILADAKDADMAFGTSSAGKNVGEERFRTIAEYREQIRQITRQGLVDIMLMSASTNYELTIREKLFENSHITPAARANDATDVFAVRHNRYIQRPALPFRTALLDHIMAGKVDPQPAERKLGADLGLYSCTFNNRLEDDLHTLEQYRLFREEAERKGFRHFLEIFDPNAPEGLSPEQVPGFVNDMIARTLAGVAGPGRPVFLKIVYHGPQSMEELVSYDPHLVAGILGGGAGTTYDAFKLLSEAKKYGARAALFGRKINNAECQLGFVEFLRRIADGEISAEEAVKAYHGVLQQLKIKPHRPLQDDMQLTSGATSYGGGSQSTVPAGIAKIIGNAKPKADKKAAGKAKEDCGCGGPSKDACSCPGEHDHGDHDGKPDFNKMTPAQKLAWNKAKRDRVFGSLTKV